MKRLAKLILVIICLSIVTPLIAGCTGSKKDNLVIYNWEDYMDPAVYEDLFKAYYKEKTGRELNIIYSKFDTNETMVTKVLNNDANVDLIAPSEYAIQKLMMYDKLHKINIENLENYNNIDPMIIELIKDTFGALEINGEIRDMSDYFVPYMWGTLGILYNADIVTEEDLSNGWGLLWNQANNPKLNGKILMKDSIRDAYAASILYAKQEGLIPEKYIDYTIADLINSVDDDILEVAKRVLLDQKKVLKGYEVDFGKDDMINLAAYVDLAWSGDAMYAIEEGYDDDGNVIVNLDYFVPEIGSNVWYDGWIIPSNSKNVEIAEMFIDFLLRPEISMMNSVYIGYTCALDKEVLMNDESAVAVLQDNDYDVEEYFFDERRYPIINETLGLMRDFGKHNEKVVAMWESVKSENDNIIGTLILIIIVIVGAIGIIVCGFVVKDKVIPKRRLIES